jgi:hypothetical protein
MLNNASFLARKFRHVNRLFREVVRIELYQNNVSGEDGFYLSRLWKPLIHFLKKEGSWILQ